MISLVSDTINKDDIKSLITWLEQDTIPRLTKGDLTIQLENKWANKIGTKYCVYVNSGSSSILLSLAALKYTGKLRNNKIVIPGLSWATDLSSPMLLNYDVHLCDCNLHDLSCDLDHLESIFKTESPAAMILVSALGLVPDMDRVSDLCKKYEVILLEDVCESMGSKYKEKYLGTFGFASFFSLYFGHHLSTIEGGFINTDDEEFYHLLLMMRSHGWDRDLPKHIQQHLRTKYNIDEFKSLYTFYVPGFNLRSTDLQAYLGITAIDKLDTFAKNRNCNFESYLSNISNNLLTLTNARSNFISNFAYPIIQKNRGGVVKELMDNKIEVRPLIAGNIANNPVWCNHYDFVKLKNCELVDECGFYVPNHQDLTEQDIKDICRILNKDYEK